MSAVEVRRDTPSRPVRSIWCEHALLPSGVAEAVTITMDGGLIVAAEPRTDAAASAILPGLTLPGFANAHSHAFHRALRGRTHAGSGDFWTWREQMYAVAARLTPDNYVALARAVFGEMLLAGYTVVGEFHYVHHAVDGSRYDDPNAMGRAIISAAHDAGIRLTLIDACYLRGGHNVGASPRQRRFLDPSVGAWERRMDAMTDFAQVKIGAAIHSVRAVDALSISQISGYAQNRSMPLHAHVSEQQLENEQTMSEHGFTPTELLASRGALSRRFTAVHATHLSSHDIQLLGDAQCTCCFCPSTERDLADGIGPSTELVSAGAALAIGSDQQSIVDPFEEVRGLEMNERLRSGRRGRHPAGTLARIGSANGYASLGWPTGGVIAAGALADLISVRMDTVRLAGSAPASALDAVIFAGTGSEVDTVIVGGRNVVVAGRHVTLDVAAALECSIRDLYAEHS